MHKIDVYHFEYTPLLIVISGPAGVGKDSLLNCMQERGEEFHFVVTATDRPPRLGEVHGVDYFFISTEEFLLMEQQDELLEQAIVYGQRKGIPKQQVRQALESGKDVIMRLDVQGAATIRQIVPNAVTIFLTAPSEREQIHRLRERGSDSLAQLEKRIRTAQKEMNTLHTFDYVVVNRHGQLNEAVNQVLAIIEAEHCRVVPRKVAL